MATDDSVSKVPGEGDYPVTIGRYPSTALARIDASLLLGAGIDADVQGEFGGDALSYYGTAVRQITLVVPSRQRDQAIQILSEAASSRPAARSEDWICSECKEINGREFDSCWSCGKPWHESDEEHVPDVPRHVLPSNDAAPMELPPLDANPYAPPIATNVVVDAGSEDMNEINRRMRRGMIFSLVFPLLFFILAWMGWQTQRKIATGQISASDKQVRWLAVMTWISGILSFLMTIVALSALNHIVMQLRSGRYW